MKRSSSRELAALFDAAGLSAGQKKHAVDRPGYKQQHGGLFSNLPKTAPKRGLSSASSGPARSGSLGSGGGSGDGALLAGRSRGLPEVTSPPPSRPLNFLAELPLSPFAKAAALADSAGAEAAPWQRDLQPAEAAADRQQQLAQRGSGSGSGSVGHEEWEEEEILEDQENQRPPSCSGAAAVPPPPTTWLFSPVRARPAGPAHAAASTPAAPAQWLGHPPPSSAPRPIPSPRLSPSAFMSTPAREALPAAAPSATPTAAAERPAGPTLTHAPSFGSWLMSAACRPPSPPSQKPPPPPAVDVSDVVGAMTFDCRAPRPFAPSGPSQLDCLLAEVGDSDYPASLFQWEREELPDSDAERA